MRPELKIIERDKNGFSTEKCKAEMYKALPICICMTNHGGVLDYVDDYNWIDSLGYIERNVDYEYWFMCPCIKQP